LGASPWPDWLGAAAAVLISLAALAALVVFGAVLLLGLSVWRSFRTTGSLPPRLVALRDAGHPVRQHKHFHYSVSQTARTAPLTEAEAEQLGLDESFQ
jgi:hypothetical protein